MRILIVDQTAEEQANLARTIDNFDQNDKDSLDIVVSLASDKDYINRLIQTDVLILGAGLGDIANDIARSAKEVSPDIEIIMFLTDKVYCGGAFRAAHLLKVRKVIPITASYLDLLQELVSIHVQFRQSGKAKKGKLTVFTQAKGGTGTTTLVAALGEICSETRQHTLLWDLDIESKDLTRSLSAYGNQSHILTEWINNTRELSRENLREASVAINSYTSILPPPHDIATGMDLLGHPDSVKIIHRLIELGRILYDNILVDTAGKLGPATGTLLHSADCIVVLIDDSLLGISAVHAYLETLLPIIRNNKSAIRFVCAGTKLPTSEIANIINEKIRFDDVCWSLPSIPTDITAAEKWPGSGKCLYSMGQKATQKALIGIADGLGLIGSSIIPIQPPVYAESSSILMPFLGKIPFLKASNA